MFDLNTDLDKHPSVGARNDDFTTKISEADWLNNFLTGQSTMTK